MKTEHFEFSVSPEVLCDGSQPPIIRRQISLRLLYKTRYLIINRRETVAKLVYTTLEEALISYAA